MPTCAEVEAGQTFLYNIAAAAAKFGQKISQPKTKVLSFGYDAPVIILDGTPLEVVPFTWDPPFRAIPLHLWMRWNAESAKHLVFLFDLRSVS